MRGGFDEAPSNDNARARLRLGSAPRAAFAAFLALVLGAASGFARDYYFDAATGADENEATEVHPCQTIAHANELSLTPGDRLLFHAGQTFPGNLVVTLSGYGDPTAPVTVGTSGAGRATIEAGAGCGIWVWNTSGVIVQDLNIVGAGADHNIGSGVRVENTLPGGHGLAFVRIARVNCSGFGGSLEAIVRPFGSPADYGQGIFVGGRPADRSKSGYRDVRIEECEAYNNQRYGILVTGAWNPLDEAYANTDVQVVNCLAHHNLGDPRMRDHHSGNGILLEEVDNGVIERCQAWENGALCNCPQGGPVGIWAAAANRIAIRNCAAFSNRTSSVDGAGFDLDGGVSNSIIEDCISHDNEGAGLLLYSYPDSPHAFTSNIARNNLCINDGRKNGMAGIAVGRFGGLFEGLDISRNIIVAAGRAGSGRAVSIFGKGAANVRFHDNLIIARDGARLIEATSQPGLTFSGNVYRPDGSPFAITFDGQEYHSLTAFREGSGQEPAETALAEFKPSPGMSIEGVISFLASALGGSGPGHPLPIAEAALFGDGK